MAVNTTKVEHSWQPGAAMTAEALADLLFDDPAHLIVEYSLTEAGARTVLEQDADYEVTVPSGGSWGTVRALAEYPVDEWLHARRVTPLRQERQFSPFSVKADAIEAMGDDAMRIAQEQAHELARAVRVPRGEDGFELPPVADRIGKFMVGDAQGRLVGAPGTGSDPDLREQLAAPGGYALIGGLGGGVVVVADETYIFTIDDTNGVVIFTSADPVQAVVPSHVLAAIPVGAGIELHQQGAGQVTIAAPVGVTVLSRDGFYKTAGQQAVAGLRKLTQGSWRAFGDLVA